MSFDMPVRRQFGHHQVSSLSLHQSSTGGVFFCSTPFSHELRRRRHRLTDHFPYCFSAGCWQRRCPRDSKAEHQKLWRAHRRRSRQHVGLIREPWVCCRQTMCLHHQSYGNFPRFQMISTPGMSVGRPACLNTSPLLRRSDEDGYWIDFHAAWALKAVGVVAFPP
jgi:hypothetical protein